MKRKLYLLLAVTAACLLCACGTVQETPAVSLPAPNQSEELPPSSPPQETILYTVSTATQAETVKTNEGVVLAESCYSLPVLGAHREDGSLILEAQTEAEAAALAVAEAFNDRFTQWKEETEQGGEGNIGANLAQYAAEDYAWRTQEGLDWYENYEAELNCTTYQTEHMVSVFGLYYCYSGGAHGNSVYLSWNFDLKNGAFFGPELLGGTELQTVVTEELKRQCAERAAEYDMKPEEMFWQDYESILADWQSYAIAFDAEGMSINYSPYELAAYAAGGQCFEIAYDFLEPYLSLQGLEILGLVEEPGA